MSKYFELEHSAMRLAGVHEEGTCIGEYCTIHKRSNHHMRNRPQIWRYDRGIMERICTHGIGHPDPDEYRVIQGYDDGVHGCDGCCQLINNEETTKILETK